jgi:hypothetical protein
MIKVQSFPLAFFSLLLGINALNSCLDPCHETSEPLVELRILNSCDYQQVVADGIIAPIQVKNSCISKQGEVSITLPLNESRKTFYLTRQGVRVDSFTIDYQLEELFQSERCGYVVRVPSLSIDTTVSSLKCEYSYDLDDYYYRDSVQVWVIYSVLSDKLASTHY